MNRRVAIQLCLRAAVTFLCAGCSSDLVVGDEGSSSVVCTGGRLTKLVVLRHNRGLLNATPEPDGGYLLFGGHARTAATTVGASGTVVSELPIPSLIAQRVDEVALAGDGAVLLGEQDSFGAATPWIGRVDTEWHLLWEHGFDQGIAQNIVMLPDGGFIIGGVAGEPANVALSRLSSDGDVVWSLFVPVPGGVPGTNPNPTPRRTVTLGQDGRINALAATSQGITLVQSSLDGVATQRQLAMTLALEVSDSVVLPDGRLAFAGARSSGAVLTMLSPDGTVEWEKLYGQGQDAEAYALAFDPARDELLLGGSYRGKDHGTQRTWMVATDLDGNQTWQLVRSPIGMDIDGNVSAASSTRGPPITDIAPQPDGSFLATGWTSDLSYFVVGAEPCGG